MKTRLIAVTGTNGKTTTATMLFEILRSAKKGVGFIGTGRIQINDRSLSFPYYSMTTPDPELLYPILSKMNQENLEFAVMEASSHALTLEKLSPLSFEIGIFTNLSEEHLDYHKSMEDYYLAKARLFENTSLALINTDDVYGRRLSRELESKSVQTFGALYNADVTATNVQGTDTFRSRYTYKAETLSFSVELSLPGIYQIYNSLPAISAAIALGISPHEAQRAIGSIEKIKGRLECIADGDFSVYLDYAHTPKALNAVLSQARQACKEGGALTLVFGCGGERDRQKRPMMARIAEQGADHVILTLDNCRKESPMQILKDTCEGFENKRLVKIISNREKAIRHAVFQLQKNDVLIVAGKGHEDYILDKNGYRPFDERKIIVDALKERKGGHTSLYENQADTAAFGI